MIGARACELLLPCVARYVGVTGARALFDRSLAISARERPWLSGAFSSGALFSGATSSTAPSPAESSIVPLDWESLRACLEKNEESPFEASTALIASLLALLASLVGAALVVQILHAHQPELFPVAISEKNV